MTSKEGAFCENNKFPFMARLSTQGCLMDKEQL